MTAGRRKRDRVLQSAIAAMGEAGLAPRLERRVDGSWVLTGLPPQAAIDDEETLHRITMAMRREAERAKVQTIQGAQVEMIRHLVWMLTVIPGRARP